MFLQVFRGSYKCRILLIGRLCTPFKGGLCTPFKGGERKEARDGVRERERKERGKGETEGERRGEAAGEDEAEGKVGEGKICLILLTVMFKLHTGVLPGGCRPPDSPHKVWGAATPPSGGPGGRAPRVA